MRAFVLTDPALASRAGQFVWLEIDTEQPRNAAFGRKHGIAALPTFFVLDPNDERVALRWVGGLTVPQVQKFLDDGRTAVAGKARTAAELALAHADRLYGEGKNAEAARAYREALAAAPAKWRSYGRAVESLLFAYQTTHACEEAVALAQEALPRLAGSPSAFAVAVGGLDCALDLPEQDPRSVERATAFEAHVRRLLAAPSLGVAADDRSAGYETMVRARKQAKDGPGARKAAEEWAGFLEAEAAKAKTPEQRAVFDSHRLSAYLELDQPDRAIPMLEASERDLPGDYNPPARLAVAYQRLKQWDKALAASDRALAKVYGPRKLRVLQARSDIQAGRGDTVAARRTLEEALAYAQALPEGQRSEATIAALEKKLASIE